jgi:HSP20 family protein
MKSSDYRTSVADLALGWQQLRRQAQPAITYFESGAAEAGAHGGLRWGVLPAEIIEKDKEIVVRLEAPGMNSADFDITVLDNMLLVAGEKRPMAEAGSGAVHVSERAYGQFERVIPLAWPVDEDNASASYVNGVLAVTLPKIKSGFCRRIEVQGD